MNQLDAYRRELRLMPYILKMEQRGINLDGPQLKTDTDFYWRKMDELDEAIQAKLGVTCDVDSNAELADAIERRGFSKGFAATPTGKRSTSKDSLIGAIADTELLGMLLVRGSIATCLRTFLQPWLVQYEKHGRLYMKWNQIRNYSDTGARTGRISSSPNLQNIPVEWEGLRAQLDGVGYTLPFDLPSVRKYIIPDPGMVFIGRDYSAQEMKLLAHFTDGALLESLRADPDETFTSSQQELLESHAKLQKHLDLLFCTALASDESRSLLVSLWVKQQQLSASILTLCRKSRSSKRS